MNTKFSLIRDSYKMELFEVNITKEQLKLIPKTERIFFILLTHMANILYTLRKLTLFCATGREESSKIVRRAENSQALLMVRLTAGYLWEGWKLLDINYFGSCISKDYDNLLSDDAKKYLNDMKLYFRNKNNVNTIRNKFAFHLLQKTPELISELIERDATEKYSLYFNENAGLCFYELPDTLINHAIFRLVKGETDWECLENLEKEIGDTTQKYLAFANDFVSQLYKKYLLSLNLQKIDLQEPPKMDEIVIPYFVLKPEKK